MPDKLTDSEIVKACKDCLHYEACKGTYSSAKGDEDILYDFDGEMFANSGCEDFEDKDLINRLQADYDRLKKSYLRNQEIFAEQSLENERLKAENERFKELFEQSQDNYWGISNLIHKYRNKAKTAKTEAYKEFAERLKKALYSDSCRLVFDSDLDIFECAIDNLLKELVGEDNA